MFAVRLARTAHLLRISLIAQRYAFAPRIRAPGPADRTVRQSHSHDPLQAACHIDLAHVVAARFQGLGHLRAELAALQLGRSVARSKVRQRDGLLNVKVPVEHADQGLGHVTDDLRAAW